LPVEINRQTRPVLAVGGHLKNTVAFAFRNKVFISQHIGDLETYQAYLAFKRATSDLPQMYEKKATAIVCDLHPDYLSTKFAEESGLPLLKVQHHYAHILSCVAENKIDYPVLGIAWDGTGYGVDGTIWGGEFLLVNQGEFKRVAHLKQFLLPGGDLAVKEPRRAGLGALYEIYGDSVNRKIPTFQSFANNELKIIFKRLKDGDTFPRTSSAGRLFDAVASIIGLKQICQFEGQAAMELEYAIGDCKIEDEYPISIVGVEDGKPDKNKETKFLNLMLDWRPLLESIIKDCFNGRSISEISIKFHNSMVKLIIEVAKRIGEKKIVLSGGCFQNRYLTERAVRKLSECGFSVYCHHSVPPNDGGIALGQAVAFSEWLTKGK
ncbi:MAG TPA: carbamoyltransferase HypF, partial [Verrucomicrobiota bacterium]|nr:carbamoyltransferase HypF [Verrucomicrobiota bacterium]